MNIVKFWKGVQEYVTSKDFCSDILSATQRSWHGEKLFIEFFENGTYRRHDVTPCNMYDPTGILVTIPYLSDEEYKELVQVVGSGEIEKLAIELRSSQLEYDLRTELKSKVQDILYRKA